MGSDRLIFGTDTPSNLCRDSYDNYVNTIAEDPDFTEQEKQNILYYNARRVFWDE